MRQSPLPLHLDKTPLSWFIERVSTDHAAGTEGGHHAAAGVVDDAQEHVGAWDGRDLINNNNITLYNMVIYK